MLDDTYGDTWISYGDLGRYITVNKAKHVLLGLDACYSGAFGIRNKPRPEAFPWQSETADCAEKVKKAFNRKSRLYFCSGSKDQRTPARSLFARRWLETLRKGADAGMVGSHDLRYYLGQIEWPQPEDGSFTNHEDGDFVFVHKNACVVQTPGLTDAAHWAQSETGASQEKLLEHLRLYPKCPHETRAIQLLSASNNGSGSEVSGSEKGLEENPSKATISYLTSKLELAQVIKVTDIEIKPMKIREGGEMVKSMNGDQVNQIQVCFKTTENEVTEKGVEIFYIRIINPIGEILAIESLGSGIFINKYKDEEMRFTMSKEISYDNQINEVCAFWFPGQDFIKGTYNVEIYNKGHLSGTNGFKLR